MVLDSVSSPISGEQGVLIRAARRRDKALKLALPPSPGRPYSSDEKARMPEEAQKLRTPQMRAALALDLNTGLRDKELRQIRWRQVDLVDKKALTVGKSKTEAGTGRLVPLREHLSSLGMRLIVTSPRRTGGRQ
jgi:integrase